MWQLSETFSWKGLRLTGAFRSAEEKCANAIATHEQAKDACPDPETPNDALLRAEQKLVQIANKYPQVTMAALKQLSTGQTDSAADALFDFAFDEDIDDEGVEKILSYLYDMARNGSEKAALYLMSMAKVERASLTQKLANTHLISLSNNHDRREMNSKVYIIALRYVTNEQHPNIGGPPLKIVPTEGPDNP